MSSLQDNHTVVCIDDDPRVLYSLRRSLRQEPYRLLTTERPEDVLKWVRSHRVSLVISDQRMPEMEGVELLAQIAMSSPATSRAILTAYAASSLLLPGLWSPVDCLLCKPWEGKELRGSIRRILRDYEMEERSETVGPGR